MKKILCVLISVIFMLAVLPMNSASFAKDESSNTGADEKSQNITDTKLPVSINCKACVLMEQSTGQILLSYNMDKKMYPASVTKIMTMLLVIEAIENGKISFDDDVVTSTVASKKGGSQIWLKEGETMKVSELFKAMAVYSANDACTALAELVGGSEEGFITLMNERAQELGMKNTNFENCTGLDDTSTSHLSTAYDIALMSRELISHDEVKKYTTIWMDSLRGGKTALVNTNKLVRFYKGATGLKTGTTAKAGCCISATAQRNGTSLIAVVLGSDNSKDRFAAATKLLNWGFSNYKTVNVKVDRSMIKDVNIIMGEEASVSPVIPSEMPVLVPSGQEKNIKQDISLAASVEAPLESSQVLGSVKITLDSKTLAVYNLTANHYVDRLTFKSVFLRMLATLGKKG